MRLWQSRARDHGDTLSRERFLRDPLGCLEAERATHGDAFWLPGRQLCIADPDAAHAVLANRQALYRDTSDFFRTRRGTFGPRAAQVEIGQAYRRTLGDRLDESRGSLERRVRALGPRSQWPDAGNRLIHGWLAELLLGPTAPVSVRRIADEVVERAVLAGARDGRSALGRIWFRYRVARELGREVDRRRARTGAEAGVPEDLLDVVVAAAPAQADEAELGEVFLSSLFAIAGSLGFALSWSVFLVGVHPLAPAEPRWVVREALRLWPVAWLLGRRPARVHTVAGVEVTPDDEVVVCPYLIHRHPDHWDRPDEFVPERWAVPTTRPARRAYLPFGRGPHTCAAATISLEIVEAFLATLLAGSRWTVEAETHRPRVDAALAPPRFTLERGHHRAVNPTKGGERRGEDRPCSQDCPVHPHH